MAEVAFLGGTDLVRIELFPHDFKPRLGIIGKVVVASIP
jgi:hypothetical protein